MNKATKTQPQAAHNILVSAHAGTDKVPADSADSAKQPAARKSTSRSLIKGDDPKAGHPEAPKNRRLRGSELEPLSDAEQADYEQKLGRLKEIEGSLRRDGNNLDQLHGPYLRRQLAALIIAARLRGPKHASELEHFPIQITHILHG